MRQVLRTSPRSIYERCVEGQSPLHLSANWPEGIQILLSHGGEELINEPDVDGLLPLAYSCAWKCVKSVKLLLNADSALYSEGEEHTSYFSNFHDILEDAMMTCKDEIITLLVDALVDRRRRLYSLAMAKLGRKALVDLRIDGDRVLDEKAFELRDALQHANVHIPIILRLPPERRTMFHLKRLTPAMCDMLYGHGFVDVDAFSASGVTPLMEMGYCDSTRLSPPLQRISWLISKGADPFRRPDQTLVNPSSREEFKTTAAHYICTWLGEALYWLEKVYGYSTMDGAIAYEELVGLKDDCQLVLGQLLLSEIYDGCHCACSSRGCTPATIMLKTMTARHDGSHPCFFLQLRVIEWVTSLPTYCREKWKWLSNEIIRYEAFEQLGLTHTCCKTFPLLLPYPRPHEECEEIQDEERFLISRLDVLVAELQEKHTELAITLLEFLRGYARTRIEEFATEDEPLDVDEIARIRDIGVTIYT